MGAAYVIFGKSVPAKWLALGTIGAVVAGASLAMSGPEAAVADSGAAVPVAKSQEGEMDVEKAINEFIAAN